MTSIKFDFKSIVDKKVAGSILLWLIITSVISSVPFFVNKVSLRENDISSANIISPSDVRFETSKNKQETQKLKEERANQVQPINDIDVNLITDSRATISTFFNTIRTLKNIPATANELRAEVLETISYKLSPKTINMLVNQRLSVLVLLEDISLRIIDDIMREGVQDIQNKAKNHELILKKQPL